MKVVAYTTLEAFEGLRDSWRELLQRAYTNTIFSTWEWHYTWWQAYQAGELWILGIYDELQQLKGIGSFFIVPDEARGRVLKFIGSEDVTDYLDLIIDRHHAEQTLEALANFLKNSAGSCFDAIEWCNVMEESPTYTHAFAVLESVGFQVSIKPQEVCPVIVLPNVFEAYEGQLDSKQSRELRRKLRKAEATGDMGWYRVGTTHDITQQLELFLGLMAKSHPQKAKFLEDAQHVHFFKAFMPIALQNGWLELCFETVRDEPVATYLNFAYGADILVYNSGIDPDKYGALSPGIVLLTHLIDDAIQRGKRIFNFLRGNETYKYLMGGRDTVIYNIRAN